MKKFFLDKILCDKNLFRFTGFISLQTYTGTIVDRLVLFCKLFLVVSYRKLSHSAVGVNNGLKLDDMTRTRLRNELHLYTDGSKNEHGLDAAFVAYIDGHETRNRTFLLDRTCSVFQAELFGIEMALMWATSFKDPPWNRSVLHSDNRCSLK